MSSILDALSTIVSDPDLTSATGKYEAATELKKVQASFYDSSDKLMDASKRLTAIYHSMLEMHKFCAQMLKRCLALGQPNSVRVQRIQAQKAQIEQNMIEIVSIQSENMRAIELLHDGNQLAIRILQHLEQSEEGNKKGCKRKADELDGESDTESSEAE